MDIISVITVAASYTEEASVTYSSLSQDILSSAQIISNLDILTHTITQTTIITP